MVVFNNLAMTEKRRFKEARVYQCKGNRI